MQLSDEYREKIRKRARRAFNGKSVHRITDVSSKTLLYRIPGWMFGRGLQQGDRILIRRDKLGRIYVPRST